MRRIKMGVLKDILDVYTEVTIKEPINIIKGGLGAIFSDDD